MAAGHVWNGSVWSDRAGGVGGRHSNQLIRSTDNVDGLRNAVEKAHAASPNEGEFSNQEVCATWRVMQGNQSGN